MPLSRKWSNLSFLAKNKDLLSLTPVDGAGDWSESLQLLVAGDHQVERFAPPHARGGLGEIPSL